MAVLTGNTSTFRLVEAKDGEQLLSDVHIISPGRGLAGYYSEAVLRKACDSGVYPAGMHMHLNHPSRTEEKEQPARLFIGRPMREYVDLIESVQNVVHIVENVAPGRHT